MPPTVLLDPFTARAMHKIGRVSTFGARLTDQPGDLKGLRYSDWVRAALVSRPTISVKDAKASLSTINSPLVPSHSVLRLAAKKGSKIDPPILNMSEEEVARAQEAFPHLPVKWYTIDPDSTSSYEEEFERVDPWVIPLLIYSNTKGIQAFEREAYGWVPVNAVVDPVEPSETALNVVSTYEHAVRCSTHLSTTIIMVGPPKHNRLHPKPIYGDLPLRRFDMTFGSGAHMGLLSSFAAPDNGELVFDATLIPETILFVAKVEFRGLDYGATYSLEITLSDADFPKVSAERVPLTQALRIFAVRCVEYSEFLGLMDILRRCPSDKVIYTTEVQQITAPMPERAWQQARQLHTLYQGGKTMPALCVIAGPPGAGKSRIMSTLNLEEGTLYDVDQLTEGVRVETEIRKIMESLPDGSPQEVMDKFWFEGEPSHADTIVNRFQATQQTHILTGGITVLAMWQTSPIQGQVAHTISVPAIPTTADLWELRGDVDLFPASSLISAAVTGSTETTIKPTTVGAAVLAFKIASQGGVEFRGID